LRTNNDIEGYHNRLKERLPNRSGTNFWVFMKALQKEEDSQTHILTQMRHGGVMRPRSSFYAVIENSISFNMNEYNQNRINHLQLLTVVSELIGN
jgi:hypothetical protein